METPAEGIADRIVQLKAALERGHSTMMFVTRKDTEPSALRTQIDMLDAQLRALIETLKFDGRFDGPEFVVQLRDILDYKVTELEKTLSDNYGRPIPLR